jgi:hypothetical protein
MLLKLAMSHMIRSFLRLFKMLLTIMTNSIKRMLPLIMQKDHLYVLFHHVICVAMTLLKADTLNLGQQVHLSDMVSGKDAKFAVHLVDYDETNDIKFKKCTKSSWLVDVTGNGEPHKVEREKKTFQVGGDGWLVLEANRSHVVLNKSKSQPLIRELVRVIFAFEETGEPELIAVCSVTESPQLLEKMSTIIQEHVHERRDLRVGSLLLD